MLLYNLFISLFLRWESYYYVAQAGPELMILRAQLLSTGITGMQLHTINLN
jgi:hypothetical protein